jgi:hypothetical protein
MGVFDLGQFGNASTWCFNFYGIITGANKWDTRGKTG